MLSLRRQFDFVISFTKSYFSVLYEVASESPRQVMLFLLFISTFIFVGEKLINLSGVVQSIASLPRDAYYFSQEYGWGGENSPAMYFISSIMVWFGSIFLAGILYSLFVKKDRWVTIILPFPVATIFLAIQEFGQLKETGWSADWINEVIVMPIYVLIGLAIAYRLLPDKK